MKRTLIIILIFTIKILAVDPPCTNGSDTKPYTGTDASKLTDWKINKFNWYTPAIPTQYMVNQTQWSGISVLKVPFEECNTAAYLALLCEEFNKFPEDGWELIKQDLGYRNNDGNGNTPKTGLTSADIPYIILYNKYKGVLRVMGIDVSDTRNFMKVTLIFSRLYQDSGKIRASGLFRNYQTNGIDGLDTETNSNITASVYTGNDNSLQNRNMFYADFAMYYDPCTCVFETGLTVEFQGSSQGQLSGVLVNGGFEDPNTGKLLASVLTNSESARTPTNDNLDDQQNNVSNGISTFKSTQDLSDRLQLVGETYEDNVTGDLSGAKDFFENASRALTAGSSIAEVTGQEELVKPLEAISKVTDFGAGLIGGEQSVMPTIGAISGTVTFNSQKKFFTIANPGSSSASNPINTMDEYGCSKDAYGNYYDCYSKPVVPMYNEVLGVFSLLKTPLANYEVDEKQRVYDDLGFITDYGYHNFTFQLPTDNSNFKYITNPAIGVKNVIIKGAIVVERMYGSSYDFAPVVLENLDLYHRSETRPYNNDYIQRTDRYITAFLEIDKLSGLVPKMSFNDHDREISETNAINVYIKLQVFLEFNESNYSKTYNNSSIFLFTYKVIKNPGPVNVHNINNTFFDFIGLDPVHQTRNYQTNINDIKSSLDLPVIDVENVTTNGSGRNPFQNPAFPNPYNIYAYNTISIASKNPIYKLGTMNIIAGDQIEITGETTISDETTLNIGTPFSNLPTITPVSFNTLADLNNFCTNANSIITYKADKSNIVARQEAEASNTSNTKPSQVARQFGTPNLTAVPNPTNGQVTFYYKVQTDGEVSIAINNVLGSKITDVIKNEFKTTGQYQKQLDLSSLAVGVYLVTIETNGYKQTERLTIMR